MNGRPLDKVRYTRPGVKHFEKPVPSDWLSADAETTVAMSVDKLYIAPQRRREVRRDSAAHWDSSKDECGAKRLTSRTMIRVIPVLFGALFTVATAWSLGMLLFRKLSLVLHVWEERLLAFVAGSACLSAIMFVLSATRLVRRGVLLVLALAIIWLRCIFRGFSLVRQDVPAAPAILALGFREWPSRPSPTSDFSTRWRPSTARTACPIT